jgi:hypothetical protein
MWNFRFSPDAYVVHKAAFPLFIGMLLPTEMEEF